MNNTYNPAEIEKRWQDYWAENETYRTLNPGDADFDPSKPKFYILDMFPYPSGSGLHVGHPLGYIGSDIVARRKRMEGYNVLHPMGFDAFGLPAEQYAIQTGKHPAETTHENSENFRRQMRLMGLSYDWTREISTCDPSYYKWTQWIFNKLYGQNLAYQAEVPVWWCEELKTVLANEEVINGRSERGDHPCERRPLKQWMLKITAYAERLIQDLDLVDWPESVKTMQREWIGKSEGAEVVFGLETIPDESLKVFTTRPDTLFGATFMVLAPEHPLVEKLVSPEQKNAVEDYQRSAAVKSELERTDLAKTKSGVFSGAYATNPVLDGENARIPIYIADYVLMGYGTGAIMAVPGHDDRDFEFAKQYDLKVIEVVQPPEGVKGVHDGVCFSGDGTAINSGALDGLSTPQAKEKVLEILEDKNLGSAQTTYRLRDWLFSRQRYWGEPFPLLHHEDGRISAVPDAELPVTLPQMTDFSPSADGSAPLARAKDWLHVQGPDGLTQRRETDTMPGWAGSCWYYLRFMDPTNTQDAFAKDIEGYWKQVDLYVGGVEHATLHLLYARFWHKVLFDLGLVSEPEPFKKLFNQGLLTAFAYKDSTGRLIPADEVTLNNDTAVHKESGETLTQVVTKMSKSLRNVVNPDHVIEENGCDTFRLYEMFMGPLSESKPWNPRDVPGCRRFIERLWRLFVDQDSTEKIRKHLLTEHSGEPEGKSLDLERHLNRTLKRVDDSFKFFNFNTAIAAMMTFVNEALKNPESLLKNQAERFLCCLCPFAPHIAEELWHRLGHLETESICSAPWPKVNDAYLSESQINWVLQINGKVRSQISLPKETNKDDVLGAARQDAKLSKYLAEKTVIKEIVVPGRLVNFVVKT
ncbi:MAG: leucine--tRNA ligase [Myxococcota bacterium]|nr:leucine--tRNA ligase [Myxococcota bacterium]